MTQTVGYFSGACGTLEVSTNASDWVNISGSTISVEPSEQSIMKESKHTLEGGAPIVTSGKLEAFDVVFNVVYNDVASEAVDEFNDFFSACNGPLYAQWSPTGTSGDPLITTGAGVLAGYTPPGVDSGSAEMRMAAFRATFPTFTEGTV